MKLATFYVYVFAVLQHEINFVSHIFHVSLELTNSLELRHSCTKPLIYAYVKWVIISTGNGFTTRGTKVA